MSLQRTVRWVMVGVVLLMGGVGAGGALAQTVAWRALGPGASGDVDPQPACGDSPRGKRAMAVDAAGNTIVVGCVSNGASYDYLTVKYAPDGSVLWSARYNGLGNNDDRGFAVAVDGAGDVLVTGYSSNGSNDDSATVKYAAATGVQLWASRYNGPANSGDYAWAVAVDSAGCCVRTTACRARTVAQRCARQQMAAPAWPPWPFRPWANASVCCASAIWKPAARRSAPIPQTLPWSARQ